MGTKLATPGDYIHARRRELAITRGQAARMAGLSEAEWRAVERDSRRPSDETLAAIAKVLRVDAGALTRRFR